MPTPPAPAPAPTVEKATAHFESAAAESRDALTDPVEALAATVNKAAPKRVAPERSVRS